MFNRSHTSSCVFRSVHKDLTVELINHLKNAGMKLALNEVFASKGKGRRESTVADLEEAVEKITLDAKETKVPSEISDGVDTSLVEVDEAQESIDTNKIFARNFIRRPWNLCASTLKSQDDLRECFAFQVKEFENNNLGSWVVDKLLGGYFKRLHQEENADIPYDIQMTNELTYRDHAITVHAAPDAKWQYKGVTYIIEIKTMKWSPTKKVHYERISQMLRQIAATQLNHDKRCDSSKSIEKYLLVVILRTGRGRKEVFSCSIVEVDPTINVRNCKKHWDDWFEVIENIEEKITFLSRYEKEECNLQSIQKALGNGKSSSVSTNESKYDPKNGLPTNGRWKK